MIKKILFSITSLFFVLFFGVTVLAATDTYTVQKGDSLWEISLKYKVGLSEIIDANPQFDNPNLIYPGDKVYVPLVDKSTVSFEEQVVALCNKEREARGLSPLEENWEVSRVARYKSVEMRDKNYFSHTSPTYGTPFDMLKKFNIEYQSAGENIAKGQKSAQAVVNMWMKSESHRNNILNPNFEQAGVGHANGDTAYWTLILIK